MYIYIYLKPGTYPHRFFHRGPAAARVRGTDIGPLLSAPRSHTGSWPYHKCEHLIDTKETQHILTRGRKVYSALTLTLFPPHIHTLSLSSSQCVRATRLPFLILAELTLRCRQQNSTHSAIIGFLCCAVALCSHLSPRNPHLTHFHSILQPQTHNPSPSLTFEACAAVHHLCF